MRRLPAVGSRISALAALTLLGAPTAAQGARSADEGVAALVRVLVLDSLRGGGARPDQLFTAADTTTARLLRRAGLAVSAAGQSGLACPGSTEADDRPVAAPTGYDVRVTVTRAGRTLRRIAVRKRCRFVYRGRGPRGFEQWGAWEARPIGGRWRVTRRLEMGMT